MLNKRRKQKQKQKKTISMALIKLKFSFLLIACQVIFVIIFGLLAEYEEPAQAKSRRGNTPITAMYPSKCQ